MNETKIIFEVSKETLKDAHYALLRVTEDSVNLVHKLGLNSSYVSFLVQGYIDMISPKSVVINIASQGAGGGTIIQSPERSLRFGGTEDDRAIL